MAAQPIRQILSCVIHNTKQFHFQEAFKAFHNDTAMVRKYMAPLKIGRLSEEPGAGKENRRKKEEEMKEDFEELRLTAEKMVKYNTIL